jgi:hypothetical protein
MYKGCWDRSRPLSSEYIDQLDLFGVALSSLVELLTFDPILATDIESTEAAELVVSIVRKDDLSIVLDSVGGPV